ncbi:MAG: DUF1987 family protein [Bacteroidetes bacterium]|nr:DUF1987 family protein [Bacteroidota bacterium]
MNKFEIKESAKIPRILIDFEHGIINFTGKSTLDNTKEFYPRIIDVVNQYINNPKHITNVLIDLEYYNAESAKYLFEILKNLDTLTTEHADEVKIFWHYDPDDYRIISDINKIKATLKCNVFAIEYELI